MTMCRGGGRCVPGTARTIGCPGRAQLDLHEAATASSAPHKFRIWPTSQMQCYPGEPSPGGSLDQVLLENSETSRLVPETYLPG